MKSGFVKIDRSITDRPMFASGNLLRLWFWLKCRAAWSYQSVPLETGGGERMVTLAPDQLIYGRHQAALAMGWPESTVRNRMAKLEELGEIEIKPIGRQFSIVTILNPDTYWKIGEPGEILEDLQDSPITKINSYTYREEDPQRGQPKDNQRTYSRKNKKDKKDLLYGTDAIFEEKRPRGGLKIISGEELVGSDCAGFSEEPAPSSPPILSEEEIGRAIAKDAGIHDRKKQKYIIPAYNMWKEDKYDEMYPELIDCGFDEDEIKNLKGSIDGIHWELFS